MNDRWKTGWKHIGKYIGHFFKVCPRQRLGWNYGLKRLRRKFQYREKTNTSSKGMTESKYCPYCSSMLCEIETRSRYSSSWGKKNLIKEALNIFFLNGEWEGLIILMPHWCRGLQFRKSPKGSYCLKKKIFEREKIITYCCENHIIVADW